MVGALCNNYKIGSLKNVDIKLKINPLKYSWIRRLYNEFHHDWKIIPLNYINNALGKNFKFYFNLSIPNKILNSLELAFLVSSQFLWYNSYIKIDKFVWCKDFADKKINYVINYAISLMKMGS